MPHDLTTPAIAQRVTAGTTTTGNLRVMWLGYNTAGGFADIRDDDGTGRKPWPDAIEVPALQITAKERAQLRRLMANRAEKVTP